MDTIYTRGFRAEAQPANDDAGSPIRFICSSPGVKRDGLSISPDQWSLDAYRANPVVLTSHDYTMQRLPVGRAENVAIEDGNLVADITFDQQDSFARDVESKYRRRFLNAVSVGWLGGGRSRKGERAAAEPCELLDVSCVVIPADSAALMQRSAAIEDLRAAGFTVTDPEGHETDDDASGRSIDWEETADEMVRLYLPDGQRTDAERRRDHRRLCRLYQRWGKEPPEFLTADELAGLAVTDVRGLFLAGETALLPDLFAATRKGAVLSSRNLDLLGPARDHIDTVIASARKEEAGDAGERSISETAEAAIAQLHADFMRRAI